MFSVLLYISTDRFYNQYIANGMNFNFTDERTWCHRVQLQLPGSRFTKDLCII